MATQNVILVHGTFSYQESDEGPAWYQRGSEAFTALQGLLKDQYQVNPQEVAVGDVQVPVSSAVFRWSGANSERSRRLAARRLLDHLRWYEEKDQEYHVVAHSHGGSVLWEALCLAAEETPAARVGRRPPAEFGRSSAGVRGVRNPLRPNPAAGGPAVAARPAPPPPARPSPAAVPF